MEKNAKDQKTEGDRGRGTLTGEGGESERIGKSEGYLSREDAVIDLFAKNYYEGGQTAGMRREYALHRW